MSVGSASNSYEILSKLAEGRMSEIFIARNVTGAGAERLVALKRLLPHHANDHNLVHMFVHDARLAAQLQHGNVAQVYDVGMLGSSYFFAMEYVHGETVRDLMLLARGLRQPLPFSIILTIVAGAAAGLQHAHERRGIDGKPLGIVHGDVSPSNLMISREGVVKVVDFGATRAAARANLSYLSPELCRGTDEIDRRSDLFSLGIVMWELITLQGLYRRRTRADNAIAIESEPALPPSQFRKDTPPELDAIALRLLAKRPQDRFQSAAELISAIESAAMHLRFTLSVPALSRTLLQWFGGRPEPWLHASSSGKQLIVGTSPVQDRAARTLSPELDAKLQTLEPALGRPPEIPGDTIPDGPPGESVEALRDRLFREAKARRDAGADVDPEDARITLQRIPPPKVNRYEPPAPRPSPAPPYAAQPPHPGHPYGGQPPYSAQPPYTPRPTPARGPTHASAARPSGVLSSSWIIVLVAAALVVLGLTVVFFVTR